MQALTKEQMEKIVQGLLNDPCTIDEVNNLIDEGAFPQIILIHDVDHERKSQYVISLEVRNDFNYCPEAVAVEATSGSLCGSCWAEYEYDILEEDAGEVCLFLRDVMFILIEALY